jgi:hypothetical protein
MAVTPRDKKPFQIIRIPSRKRMNVSEIHLFLESPLTTEESAEKVHTGEVNQRKKMVVENESEGRKFLMEDGRKVKKDVESGLREEEKKRIKRTREISLGGLTGDLKVDNAVKQRKRDKERTQHIVNSLYAQKEKVKANDPSPLLPPPKPIRHNLPTDKPNTPATKTKINRAKMHPQLLVSYCNSVLTFSILGEIY